MLDKNLRSEIEVFNNLNVFFKQSINNTLLMIKYYFTLLLIVSFFSYIFNLISFYHLIYVLISNSFCAIFIYSNSNCSTYENTLKKFVDKNKQIEKTYSISLKASNAYIEKIIIIIYKFIIICCIIIICYFFSFVKKGGGGADGTLVLI